LLCSRKGLGRVKIESMMDIIHASIDLWAGATPLNRGAGMALVQAPSKSGSHERGPRKMPCRRARRRGSGAASLPVGVRYSFLALPPKAGVFSIFGKRAATPPFSQKSPSASFSKFVKPAPTDVKDAKLAGHLHHGCVGSYLWAWAGYSIIFRIANRQRRLIHVVRRTLFSRPNC